MEEDEEFGEFGIAGANQAVVQQDSTSPVATFARENDIFVIIAAATELFLANLTTCGGSVIEPCDLKETFRQAIDIVHDPCLPSYTANMKHQRAFPPPSPFAVHVASHGAAATTYCAKTVSSLLSTTARSEYVGVSTLQLRGVHVSATLSGMIQRGLALRRRLPASAIQAATPLGFDLGCTMDRLAGLQVSDIRFARYFVQQR